MEKVSNRIRFQPNQDILQGKVAAVNAVGFMTGENPMAQKMSSKQNRALNKELMAWMRDRGYGPIRIRGKFGNKERSMIIPNITREDMIEAGKQFNQESVIWGEKTGEDKFVFEYIEGDKTLQKRDAVLFDDEVWLVRTLFSEAVCWTQVFYSFFDEQYEMEEGFEYDYDLRSKRNTEQNKEL